MDLDLAQLVEAWPEPAWIIAPNRTTQAINAPWRNYVGDAFQPPVSSWADALHPLDRAEAEMRWIALEGGGQGGEVVARLRRADGVYRRFSIKFALLTASSGEALGWLATATDLEAAGHVSANALDHPGRFEQLLENLPLNTALYAESGRIIFANRRMLAFHGQTLKQLQDGAAGYTYHPAERGLVLGRYRQALTTGKAFHCEARLRRADGLYRWHLVQGFPLRDAEGGVDLWFGLSHDIEDVRHAEAELAAETDLLEMAASGGHLDDLLESVCRQVEALAPGAVCSILSNLPGDGRLRVAAGAHLPTPYRAMLEAAPFTAEGGPGALAARLKAPVVATDLVADPRWQATGWPKLVEEVGLRSCWSVPVLAGDQQVLGALSVHRHDASEPMAGQLRTLARFANILGLAMDRAAGSDGLPNPRRGAQDVEA